MIAVCLVHAIHIIIKTADIIQGGFGVGVGRSGKRVRETLDWEQVAVIRAIKTIKESRGDDDAEERDVESSPGLSYPQCGNKTDK